MKHTLNAGTYPSTASDGSTVRQFPLFVCMWTTHHPQWQPKRTKRHNAVRHLSLNSFASAEVSHDCNSNQQNATRSPILYHSQISSTTSTMGGAAGAIPFCGPPYGRTTAREAIKTRVHEGNLSSSVPRRRAVLHEIRELCQLALCRVTPSSLKRRFPRNKYISGSSI
jgi:hypothetical protein